MTDGRATELLPAVTIGASVVEADADAVSFSAAVMEAEVKAGASVVEADVDAVPFSAAVVEADVDALPLDASVVEADVEAKLVAAALGAVICPSPLTLELEESLG